jgi:hypothetical protein
MPDIWEELSKKHLRKTSAVKTSFGINNQQITPELILHVHSKLSEKGISGDS